jgi:hypothetical protein
MEHCRVSRFKEQGARFKDKRPKAKGKRQRI